MLKQRLLLTIKRLDYHYKLKLSKEALLEARSKYVRAKNKARNVKNFQTQLESRLQSLAQKISSDAATKDDSQVFERVKTELRVSYESKYTKKNKLCIAIQLRF